ncbi:S9 family peptidase [Kaistella antarctica]|uniref:Prolyl tripeptidyl peptidase n=1 Tax=Kaistella antarctica TaxID=266748 RepID=A0A3S5EV00_9FLAO|nr:S9 family peptidase [Kaistella antarctica]KEY20276.1 prolyl tripeptidyl peptidase [Kaistella antarctica]SEV91551.1 dipeptidyl-peptidase-4 [Kaistella antarctica]VEI01609.1 Prolyl tripeptidyl peptidase precursor [Kaistella antarctica]
MKISKLSFLFLFSGSFLFAQTQKFTIAEAVNGLRSNLAVKNISQFSWADDGKSFYEGTKNGYLMTDVSTNKVDTLVSLHQLNTTLSLDKKLKSFPRITFVNKNKGYFTQNSQNFWIERSGKEWKIKEGLTLDKEAENSQMLNDHQDFVYTVGNNLYLNKNGKVVAITTDGTKDIVNGKAVHQQEFGIDKGIFISPDNSKIAFYRMDQSMVKDYPIIDWSVVPAVNKNIKYPMAGTPSHHVTLGVYDIKTNKTTFLNIEGDPEQYLTVVTWNPDSKSVFVGVLNRDQNDLKMNQYNASTGSFMKMLFEEKSDKYVEPQQPLLFFPNSTTDFIWQSQRTGYNHLFHYNIDKGLVAQLTKGDWLVTDILGFNEKKKEIFYVSTQESPMERHLYKVDWTNFKTQRLDQGAGMHSGVLSKDGNHLYDTYSNATTPRTINLINMNTLKVKNVLTSENPLKSYQRPEIKNLTLKADDGTPLYGKIILPTDFDANRKYPVIVYLYNGPHAQLVTDSFPASGNLWYEFMAQKGYVVFTMDGRGSSNRGLKFEQAIFRNAGETEMKDQLQGVAYLKSLPYVDGNRLGIHGWSYGGFMTTSFMLKNPEVFKVGVAGGPVIDWNMYEIMYTERYMDSPQKNPEGYKQANLLDKVQNLKGHLLMIHGAQDNVVVWQHSMNFLKAAVDHGVQMDYFVYPGHEHNVLGKDRVHLMQKVTDYFDEYLKK